MQYYPKHYCGVFGIYGHPNAAQLTYYGLYALQHRGQESAGILTNAVKVRDELEAQGLMFQTSVDSEIILNLLAQPTLRGNDNNLSETMRRIEGAYSLAILTQRELIGVRDPHGFRPLSIGMVDGAYVLSSETCAFDLIHAKFIRDVEPGEIVIIDKNGLRSIQAFPDHQRRAF